MELLPFPIEFAIFGITLISVALFHRHTLPIALLGLISVLSYKLGFTNFDMIALLKHEAKTVVNLLGLLVGFALLARHFELSGLPDKIPHFLPQDWKAGAALLGMVFILSTFLDNIAAAIIGGSLAKVVFEDKVHIGFLAGIVAASNAGGAGSVLGDTTTTMMWISGVSAGMVLHAFVGSIVAFLVFAWIASYQQHKYQPIAPPSHIKHKKIDKARLFIVVSILVGALVTNLLLDFPALGVWIALLAGAPIRKPDWHEVPGALKGAAFLLALVLCASMMPVETLPAATWSSTIGLGFISAFFDNIPLTALAIKQGGYDWGILAFAVGYGGSLTWFGSSAGVALSNSFPESRSLLNWFKGGWHLPIACLAGFAAMLLLMGWQPEPHPMHVVPAVQQVVTQPRLDTKVPNKTIKVKVQKIQTHGELNKPGLKGIH